MALHQCNQWLSVGIMAEGHNNDPNNTTNLTAVERVIYLADSIEDGYVRTPSRPPHAPQICRISALRRNGVFAQITRCPAILAGVSLQRPPFFGGSYP